MRRPRNIALCLLVCLGISAPAKADDMEDWLLKVGDYQSLYERWSRSALTGGPEEHERVATLLLGPQGSRIKHPAREGIRYLYLAAIGGRRTAMLRLSQALGKGEDGIKQSPAAARCWAQVPSRHDAMLACVELTDFVDRRGRPRCGDLSAGGSGADLARLCLANKTPSLLEPGPPPGELTLRRIREYEKQGIELQITGDVYEEDFERFRNAFNRTMVDAIEKTHGPGYLVRLDKEIADRINASGVRPR